MNKRGEKGYRHSGEHIDSILLSAQGQINVVLTRKTRNREEAEQDTVSDRCRETERGGFIGLFCQ